MELEEEGSMRKLVVTLSVVGLLGGPLGSIAQADLMCDIHKKTGLVQYVRECEDPVE
jgi:hypothetical protein